MSIKKRSYAAKIRQILRKEKIDIDPLLDATLEELERLSVIRDDLFESYQDEDAKLFREYTNKAGVTNVIIAAEVTEYKNYSDKFNKTVAAIEKMVEARRPVKDDSKQQEDPLAKIIKRDLNAQS